MWILLLSLRYGQPFGIISDLLTNEVSAVTSNNLAYFATSGGIMKYPESGTAKYLVLEFNFPLR